MSTRRGYLTGEEALHVARMTGLPMRSPWHKPVEPADVDARAIHDPGHPFYIDLTRLPYWDRMRVAWARIGLHNLTKGLPWSSSAFSPSGLSARSSLASPGNVAPTGA